MEGPGPCDGRRPWPPMAADGHGVGTRVATAGVAVRGSAIVGEHCDVGIGGWGYGGD
jgi:hypothetical protein